MYESSQTLKTLQLDEGDTWSWDGVSVTKRYTMSVKVYRDILRYTKIYSPLYIITVI